MVGGIENEGESMPRTRKSHPPSLKARVAVEAIKAHKTAAQIAQMFGVHPTQVGGWKKQALAGLPDIFGNGREQIRQLADAEKDELYKQIGQLPKSPKPVTNTLTSEGAPGLTSKDYRFSGSVERPVFPGCSQARHSATWSAEAGPPSPEFQARRLGARRRPERDSFNA